MPSTPGERRPGRTTQAPAQEAEHLPCPRCKSTNTKFCYYNNYNLAQPRHFCKSCRRYWTQGGTLRNVPVGGGSRKNSSTKRFRSSSDTTTTQSLPSPPSSSLPPVSPSTVPVPASCPNANIWKLPVLTGTDISGSLSFSSFLGTSSEEGEVLGALGLEESFLGRGELEMAKEEMGVWPLADAGEGDCFAWPEMAISTPGKSFV